MPCLKTAITSSHAIENTGEKNKKQNKQNKTFFTIKIQHLNLKAPSHQIKIQPEENLTTQTYFFNTTKQIGLYIN